ncbi:hypothetical protein LZ554_000857 [Drepanopeziza brunnea f. sp. 'monogermtubi']|nr:hypothetical protein LZ554_000857 [Drepanopeziza brunnea f. sp. 'monogermtubi']
MVPSSSKNRQSGPSIQSFINRGGEPITITTTDRPYPPTMATSTGISPTASMYQQPPPPYSSGWSAPSLAGLMSPTDSRRPSDYRTESPRPLSASRSHPHRLSLPSIHEALSSSGSSSNVYMSPVSASGPPSHQIAYSPGPETPRSYPPPPPPPPSQPTPYSQRPETPRSYPLPEQRRYSTQSATPRLPRPTSPPQPVHPAQFPRPEPAPLPELNRRPSSSYRPAVQAPPNQHAMPRYEPARHEPDSRSHDRVPQDYVQRPAQQQPTYAYGPPYRPMSPPPPGSHHGPVFIPPQYDPREMETRWARDEKREPTAAFRQGLKRHFEVYNFENNLATVNKLSSTIAAWSAHYNAILSEQQPSAMLVPDRMPTLESVDETLSQHETLFHALTDMRAMIVEQNARLHHSMNPSGGGDYDDESSYGDDNHDFKGPDSKKRRGKIAPPGRCHACNRSKTPEWRRGPDGARTLCNACGLHFAKISRKHKAEMGAAAALQQQQQQQQQPNKNVDILPPPGRN